MGGYLKQSTAATVKFGPFVDDTDGKTAETGLTLQKADIRLSKNGGNMAAASADQGASDAGAAHDELGYYDISLDTTDTGTLGRLKIMATKSGALPVWDEYMVIPAMMYDSIVAGSDRLDVNVTHVGDTEQTANDNGADINAILADTGTDGVVVATNNDKTGYGLADDAITAAKFDESTAYPLASADTGATAVARTGADSDTLETLSDEIAAIPTNPVLDTEDGSSFTAVPWNAAWDAEVQSECADALTAYDAVVPADLPTNFGALGIEADGDLTKVNTLDGHTAQTGDNYARLGAPAGASVSADVAAVKTDTGNIVSRITATLFSGITSLAEWLGLIAGKQTGDATARTELRATGAGSGTYDETADSQEAIRDRGDAAWTTGAGGSAPTVEEIRTEMDSNSTQLAAIVEDTGTTIPATLTTMEGKIDTLDTNVDTLITRLSAARAAYLDNLSGGAVALASAVATVDTVVDAIKVVTDALPDSGALTSISTATDRLTAARAAAIDDLIDGGRLDLLIDAIKAKTDNLPEGVKKNTALSNFPVVMVLSSDHVTPATGKTVTGQRSLDGAALEAVTGAIAEVSNGLYQFDAAAGDTNGDTIAWRFSADDCDDTWVTIKTEA